MSLAGWALANPAGLWWALLTLPILALHVLRPRRTQAEVNSTLLWQAVARPVSAAHPWQRLIPSWLLFAQLLAALLFALAMARPVQLTDAVLADHTIFVVDTSASMGASDGSPNRLADARLRVAALVDELPDGAETSVVVSGPPARAIITGATDATSIERALARVEVSDGTDDLAGALALAAGLNVDPDRTQVVLVSDGRVADADLRAAPPGARFEAVGSGEINRGISSLSVEATPDGLTARLTVRNYGGPEATQLVRIDVDGVTAWSEEITVAPGAAVSRSATIPTGSKVEAFLGADDLLASDNRAVAVLGLRPRLRVAWLGPDNAFLGAALQSLHDVELTRYDRWPDVEAAIADGLVDVLVSDGVSVGDDPGVGTLAIATGGTGGVTASGTVVGPALVYVHPTDPLVRGLDFTEVLVGSAEQLIMPADGQLLLGAEGAPLLVRSDETLYLGFPLQESTLPLSASFPLLVDRAITELAGSLVPPSRLTVGAPVPLDRRREATISFPDGSSATLPPGSATVSADQIGFWRVEQPGLPATLLAVNGDPAESTIDPAAELPLAAAFEGEEAATVAGQISLLRWVALALLAIVAVEYLLARRRVGVSPRQWRLAAGLRVAVALALVVVVIAPTFTRPSNRLATVFVVDASDSMGATGRAQAGAFVVDALAAMPDDAEAGVVVFGAQSRLENIVSASPSFARISVQVDASATDVSSALRLAAASLPADRRGRIVVVSDGRATNGDHRAEVERLAADGVPVDVVEIVPPTTDDVAVTAVRTPARAATGDEIRIEVAVEASVAGPALARLFAGGELIEEREVDLPLGPSSIVFTDTVGSAALARYQAEVVRSTDLTPTNDIGFAAIPIESAQRVLLVTGSTDTAVEAALVAGGLDVEVVAPVGLPAVDELATYAAIVLDDVDRRDLSDVQVAGLVNAVRDLGRGLVVVGGDHSYALGGYRNSDLEEILPVVSEITDPLRRQTVAEVLAIDTSGSMGACHCDEEGANGLGGGSRIDGGVDKTTIARVAAAEAIAALAATDEVGVLSVNADAEWLIDLQVRPDEATVEDGLSMINPDGPTNLAPGLSTAADALRQSNASLKHIIFFSDGFTEPGHLDQMEAEAAALAAEGITVSVVATGEGAAEDLRPIAEAGGGRFYPGRNLEQIPALIVEEAVLASRNFVNEGEFVPTIASNGPAVRSLTAAPPLFGYVATSPKASTRVDLLVGDANDPLLASWRVGLGRVTTWTADNGERWAQGWDGWDGAPDFWSAVVRETFPSGAEGGTVTATVSGDQLDVVVEGAETWDDDAQAVARVAAPDGTSIEVPLDRVSATTFAGTASVDQVGSYAVGGVVEVGGEAAWSSVGLANRSYSAEYRPAGGQANVLDAVAGGTGGRVGIDATDAFSGRNTTAGRVVWSLAPLLLLLSTLLWPVAVAVSRLAWRRAPAAVGRRPVASAARQLADRRPRIAEPARRPTATVPPASTAPPASSAPPTPSESPTASSPPAGDAPAPAANAPAEPADGSDGDGSTVNRLLAAKRRRGDEPRR